MTHLEKKILAVIRTTVMYHNKVWLHYSSLVAQLNESRHWVLPCTHIKGQNKVRGWNKLTKGKAENQILEYQDGITVLFLFSLFWISFSFLVFVTCTIVSNFDKLFDLMDILMFI